jgi:hypothetical protein
LKKVENFGGTKSDHQLTMFHHQFTTNSPQKTTLKTRTFAKTPRKNAPFTTVKKVNLQSTVSPCQKQRESASCSISEVLLWH